MRAVSSTKTSFARRSLRTFLVIAALSGIYMLSFGIFIWLSRHGYVSPPFKKVGIVYAPIILLLTFGPEPIKDLISWYMSLWG